MSAAAARSERLSRALDAARALGADGLLVTRIENVRWLTGFTGSAGVVLVGPHPPVLATDARYTEQATHESSGMTIEELPAGARSAVGEMLGRAGARKIGIEADHVTLALHGRLRAQAPGYVELVETSGLIERLRMIKDSSEVEAIAAACKVVDLAFEYVADRIEPGRTERDVMLDLEWHIRSSLHAEVAFDTIVASGPRSALPHGRASERTIVRGDFVTLDFGARVDGYCSDITRTVVVGRATDEQRRVYSVVRDALLIAVAACRPGASGSDVDGLARSFISDAGYGDLFVHGLGHQIGMAVHDAACLGPTSSVTLAPGMVTTVEPGIYRPEWGGVRIEQDVLITDDTAQVLTQSTTELLEV